MSTPAAANAVPPEVVSVPIGRWAVARAPVTLRTLLGSCLGVILHDRHSRVGGLAHVVLPDSRGSADHPGKYADTAIPALLADLAKTLGTRTAPRVTAKLFGGASMFQQSSPAMDIGRQNCEAVEQVLTGLGVLVLARDVGGETGRRLTFDTQTGIVTVKIPGGAEYDV